MEFGFAIALILVILVIPAVVKKVRRVPDYSKFGDHEIFNPNRNKTARCKKCRKIFEWKGTSWKVMKSQG
jgi:uncharacterized protein with PIN domain